MTNLEQVIKSKSLIFTSISLRNKLRLLLILTVNLLPRDTLEKEIIGRLRKEEIEE